MSLTVEIWWSDLRDRLLPTNSLRSLLSPDECERADRFLREQHRDRYIRTRALLRQLAGRYLARDPASLVFSYSDRGKPYLPGLSLQFNLSHSHDFAVFAFSRTTPVGIDVEYCDRDKDVDGLIRRFFALSERQVLTALPAIARRQAFYTCWTYKEAYAKATDLPLADCLHQVDVSSAIAVPNEPFLYGAWAIAPLSLHVDFAVAVAASAKDTSFHLMGSSNI